MSAICLEAPYLHARRVWWEQPDRPPLLLRPLRSHVAKFGERFWWGDSSHGSHLTAATLLYAAGMSLRLSAHFAARYVHEWLEGVWGSVVRIELDALKRVVEHYLSDYPKEVIDAYRSGRRPPHA